MWYYPQLFLKLFFCCISGIIYTIEFTWGSISFHKQKKQSTKYQDMDIASLMKSISVTFVMS